MDNIELGRRIKESREACGKTLLEVATEVGIHKSTVQRYEQGQITRPKLPVIESIASACGVNPVWLIGKSNDMYGKKTPINIDATRSHKCSDEEYEIVLAYRMASLSDREIIDNITKRYIKAEAAEAAKQIKDA